MPTLSQHQRDNTEACKKRIIRVFTMDGRWINIKTLTYALNICPTSFYKGGVWRRALDELIAEGVIVKELGQYNIKHPCQSNSS
jgi:hypothetical protein